MMNSNTKKWLDNNKAIITHDGKHAILFKAVGKNLKSKESSYYASIWHNSNKLEQKMVEPYEPGKRLVAPDFRNDSGCGGGLHLCASPGAAQVFAPFTGARYLACEVRIDDIIPVSTANSKKCKVQSLRVLKEIQHKTSKAPETIWSGSHWYPKVGDEFEESRSGQRYRVTQIVGGGWTRRIHMERLDGKRTTNVSSKTFNNYRAFRKSNPKYNTKSYPSYHEQVEELR